MKRSFYLAAFILILSKTVSIAQSPDLKETFLEAESYFLFEEYNEALPLYLRIHRAEPNNNNINYKIGICFLNDPYQKEKSIYYLEEASKDVNPKYKNNNFKETTAPLETFFYLGNAYLVNNDIDKALENYRYFRSILDEKIYDVELVEEQIRICERARDLRNKPVDYDFIDLPEVINSRFSDVNPIVSGDGKKLVFVSKRQFYDATFYSEKVDGAWQPPRNIIPELGVDGDVYPTSLSWDGSMMIIYRNDDFIGNLYVSHLVDGSWSPMEKLGDNINTKYWESHGSLSKDGKTLYFTSNRKEGYGGLDIYKSKLQGDGSWGIPVNLGPQINTRYNEETPFITENGKILYFSSYGHYNMGGYDVFYSIADKDGNWGTPINLGYPINTTDDDLFFYPIDNGNHAYFSQYFEDGYGRHDIYYLTVYSDNNPRMYMISGLLASDKGEIGEDDDLMIYLIDKKTGDTIQGTRPDLTKQSFEIKAPKGEYDLLLRSTTFNDLLTKISIDEKTEKTGIKIPEELALETKPYVPQVLTGDASRIMLEDTVFDAKPGKLMKIRLGLEKDSKLYADHSANGTIIKTDSFNIDKKRFVYELMPEAGQNVVTFEMIEQNGDKSLKTVVINVPVGESKLSEETQIKDIPDAEVLVEQPAEPVSDSIYAKMQEEIDRLASLAEGDLKAALEIIDAKEEGITSMDELYKYLEEQGFSKSELEDLKMVSKVNNDADNLLKRMIQNSDGELHEYLKTIDLDELGISSAAELLDHLRKTTGEDGFSDQDINQSFSKIAASPKEVKKTLNELKSYAQGDLLNYLQKLNTEESEIFSSSALLDHLIDQVGESYEPELLISVLSDMVSTRPLESFVSYLIANGPPNLAAFLKDLDLRKEGITSISELIAYLLKNADKIGISEEELEMLIINLMADFTIAPILNSDPILQKKGIPAELKITGGLLFAGILIFLIFFLRKRKKKEEQE